MSSKVIGSIFLIVAVGLIAIMGVAALQAQSDIGDTQINESSDNYDTYQQVKNTSAMSMQVVSFAPYLLVLLLLAVLGTMMGGALVYFKMKK